MFVDGDLLCGVIGLRGQVAMIVQKRLMLRVQFEALIFKIVAFLEDCLQLEGESVVDELVLDGRLELLEQLDQLIDLDLVAFHKLLLVTHDRALECLVHALRRLLNVHQEPLYETLRLFH